VDPASVVQRASAFGAESPALRAHDARRNAGLPRGLARDRGPVRIPVDLSRRRLAGPAAAEPGAPAADRPAAVPRHRVRADALLRAVAMPRASLRLVGSDAGSGAEPRDGSALARPRAGPRALAFARRFALRHR